MFCFVWWISHRFGKTLFFVFTLSFEGNAWANVQSNIWQYHMAISTWWESSHRIYSSILTKLHWYQWVKSLYKYWIFIWNWAHLIVALWVPSYIPNGVHWIEFHSNGSTEVKIIMIVSIEFDRWKSNSVDGNRIRSMAIEFDRWQPNLGDNLKQKNFGCNWLKMLIIYLQSSEISNR